NPRSRCEIRLTSEAAQHLADESSRTAAITNWTATARVVPRQDSLNQRSIPDEEAAFSWVQSLPSLQARGVGRTRRSACPPVQCYPLFRNRLKGGIHVGTIDPDRNSDHVRDRHSRALSGEPPARGGPSQADSPGRRGDFGHIVV